MDQDERVGTSLRFRCQHLDVDLARHNLLAGLPDILAADVEIAALGHRRLIDRRHR
jgi:hypothetical protein